MSTVTVPAFGKEIKSVIVDFSLEPLHAESTTGAPEDEGSHTAEEIQTVRK